MTDDPRNVGWIDACAAELLLALFAFALGGVFQVDPRATFHGTSAGCAAGCLAALPLLVLLSVLLRLDWRPFVELRRIVSEMVERLVGRNRFAPIPLGLAAGFAEELLFRGFLEEYLSGRFGLWIGVFVAAAVFGLLHAASLLYFAIACAFSLYFSMLWRLTGDLAAPMAAHALYDAVALYWVVRSLPDPSPPASEPPPGDAPL